MQEDISRVSLRVEDVGIDGGGLLAVVDLGGGGNSHN